jgi:hypothetical protein
MDIVAVLHDLDATDGHIGGAAQQIKQTDSGVAGKTLIDHLERWHSPTHDTLMAGQIIWPYAISILIGIVFGLDITVINTVQQRIYFIL